MKNLIKAAGLGLVLLSSSFFANAAQAAEKVAYVNTPAVFQALPQREVAMKQMQQEFKDRAAELQNIKTEAQEKIQKLKRDGSIMKQADVEKLRIEIGQLESTYKIKGQALEQESQRREGLERQKLFKVIQAAVKKVATKQGYDMVVDAQALRYANPKYDITQEVIKELK